MKKMWLVKREVVAESIWEAMRGKGRIYSIEEADPVNHPEERKPAGFILNGNKNKKQSNKG